MANQIRYQVNFDVNQNGLNQLKSSLQSLQKMKLSDIMKINNTDISAATTIFNNIKTQAMNVESALKSAFNTKLNTYNIEAFNTSLRQSGSSIEQVYQSFRRAGTSGQAAFRNLSTQVLSTNIQLKQSHAWLDKMASTLANTIKWNAASAAIRGVTSSIQQAWGFTKSLDTSLNNIRIVTGKSADEMGKFAVQANNAAKELGKTTTDYTNAALIYAQQGLSDKEIQERARITLKTASVTGQSTEAVSQQLTAVWNGYKVSADEAELYVDRLAAVAAKSASNLAELSTGMSKVASAAATMGVGEQQLAAQLSTIISVTRQAPESVGTALRTIYARISDIKAGIDEDGVSLGNYSGKLADLGFNVLDANNNLRDMGEVIEEIGSRWGDLTRQQQISLTQTMAGQRQYNNLLALFDNFEKYNEMLNVASNAEGTLQQQQDIRMESTAAHLDILKASVQDIYDSLADTDSINKIIDGLSNAATFTAKFVDSLGGGQAVLSSLGAIGFSVFSQQIANGIQTTINNLENAKNQANQFKAAIQQAENLQAKGLGNDYTKFLIGEQANLLKIGNNLPVEDFNAIKQKLQQLSQTSGQIDILREKMDALRTGFNTLGLDIDKAASQWGSLDDMLKSADGIEVIKNALNNLKDSFNPVTEKQQQMREAFKTMYADIESGSPNAARSFDNLKSSMMDFINSLKTNTLKDSTDSLFSALPESARKSVLKAKFELQQLDFSNIGNAQEASNKITQIFGSLNQTITNEINNIKELIKSADAGELEGLQEKLKNLLNLQQQARNGYEALRERADRTMSVQQITKIASGIGQMGSAIMQVQNLGNIWKNQDLSIGQKLLQTITNLSFALPMLITGFTKVTTAMGLMKTMSLEEAINEGIAITAETAHSVSLGALSIAATQAGIQIQFLNGVLVIHPFVMFAAAALAAVTALGAFSNAAEKARKNAIELDKSSIEEEKKKQEEIEKNKELITSLQELDTTRSDLKTAVEELIEQYGLEGQAADKLAGSYQNLAEGILEFKEQTAEQMQKSAERQKQVAEDLLYNTAIGTKSGRETATGNYSLDLNFGNTRKDQPQVIQNIIKEAGFQEQFDSFSGTGNGIFSMILGKDYTMDDLVSLYDTVSKIVTDINELDAETLDVKDKNNSEYFLQMQAWVGEMEEAVKLYTTARDNLSQASADATAVKAEKEGNVDFSDIEFISQYIEQREQLINQIKAELIAKNDEISDATELADTYIKQNFKTLYDRYARATDYILSWREKTGGFSNIAQDLVGRLAPGQLDALLSLDQSTIIGWESIGRVAKILAGMNFLENNQIKELDIGEMQQSASDKYNIYQSLQDQVSGRKTISEKEYESLDPEIQEFFSMMANGSYKMTEDAKAFYETVNDLKLEGFYQTIDAIDKQLAQMQALSDKNFDYNKLNTVAYDKDQQFDESYMVDDNHVNRELVGEQLEYLKVTEQNNVVLQIQIKLWEHLLKYGLLTEQQVKNIATAIRQTGDQTSDLAEKMQDLEATSEEVAHQLFDAMFPTDQDVDLDALASLTDIIQDVADSTDDLVGKQLADELTQDRRAAEDVAEAILRFDDAIQDVIDGYDDWMGALNNGSLQDQAEIMDDLRDAYADLLDIDGSSLSDDFLTNTQNLDLMKDAINGDIDAYNQLAQAAATDILMTLGLNDEQALTHFQNDLAWIQSFDSAVFGNIADLAVGAQLNDQAFLDGLTNMVNAAGMTAQQATDYLSSMGVDAEVIENTTEDTQENDITGYTGEAVPVTGTVNFPTVSASTTENGVVIEQGTPISETWEYDALKVNPDTAQILSKKQNKSFGLKVTSAHKSSGGGFKFSQAKNGGGTSGTARRSPSGSGKGGGSKPKKGSGGKGGGSGKEVKPDKTQKDKKQKLEDERDLYHDINIELNKINTTLNRIEKIQDRLYGKKLIDNLNKQKEILKQHIETLQAKQKIQKEDLAQQKKTLENLGVSFDSYGNISNYMDILKKKQDQLNKQIEEYNALIEKYNASTDKEVKDQMKDQIDILSKQIDKSQKAYDKLKDKISDYDKLREDMEKLVDDIDEDIQRQIEINITKFRMEVEIRLDMGQAQRDWNKFRRQVLEHTDIIKDSDFSKIYKDAQLNYNDAVSYFDINGHKGTIQTLTQQLKETRGQIEKIDKTGYSAIYGDNKKEAMDHLKSDLKELMEQIEDYEKLFDEVDQAYLDTIDNSKDQMDKQVDDYEYITELYQHDMDLLTLLYGDKNYDAMNKYYSSVHQNQLKELDFLKKESEFWKEKWDAAAMAGDTKAAEQFEKHYRDSIKNLNSVIEESAKTLQDKYTNAIDKIFDELDKKISGGMGTDYLSMEWELMNKNADQYLDTINAAFAIQDIQRKYQNAINDTKSIKSQRTLKQLMDEQVNKLQEKDRLSQYDVDRAEKLLQLQRARIALEDAQSAKTSMRLKRDAQGNYSYQYVADDTEIQDAQQNLLDLQQDLYNFDKEAYKKNLNDMLSAWKDFQSRYKEIVLDTSLTEEQKVEQLALLRQKYGKYINDKTQENYTIRLNFTDSFYDSMDLLYKQNLSNYQWMTGEEKKSLKDNLDANKEKYKTVIGDQLKLFQNYRKEYDKILSSDLTEEEKVAALEKLTREYEQNLTKLKGQEIQARQDLEEAGFRISAGFYTDNYEDYKNMLDYQAEKLTSDFLPTWNGGIQQMAESVAGQGGFLPTCDQAFEDIDQTTRNYEQELDNLALTAGIDLGQIKSGVDEIAQAFEKLTPDNDQFLERINQDLAAMEQLRSEMQRLKEENQLALNQAIAAATQTHEYIQEQQGKAADAAHEEKKQMLAEPTWTVKEEPKVFDPATTIPKETKKEKKEKKKEENTQSLESLAEGIAGSIWIHGEASGWGDQPSREKNMIKKFGKEKGKKLYPEVQKWQNAWKYTDAYPEHSRSYYEKYLMSKFKSGGYTGDWAGEEGKIGILHQKELVLNKEDTKNLLSAVNIMRTIMSSIGGTIANKLGDLRSGVINATNDSNNTVEQSVHIEASFPNVNSKREIQEAFNELVNLAAQRAMKR